ncbi:purine and uridine phosphorylase [Colletotrichum asianum]
MPRELAASSTVIRQGLLILLNGRSNDSRISLTGRKMAQQRGHDDYKVAWICPLEVEQIAALEMLDEEYPALPKSAADHNIYSLRAVNGHNIVIAGLYQPRNYSAATVVA